MKRLSGRGEEGKGGLEKQHAATELWRKRDLLGRRSRVIKTLIGSKPFVFFNTRGPDPCPLLSPSLGQT